MAWRGDAAPRRRSVPKKFPGYRAVRWGIDGYQYPTRGPSYHFEKSLGYTTPFQLRGTTQNVRRVGVNEDSGDDDEYSSYLPRERDQEEFHLDDFVIAKSRSTQKEKRRRKHDGTTTHHRFPHSTTKAAEETKDNDNSNLPAAEFGSPSSAVALTTTAASTANTGRRLLAHLLMTKPVGNSLLPPPSSSPGLTRQTSVPTQFSGAPLPQESSDPTPPPSTTSALFRTVSAPATFNPSRGVQKSFGSVVVPRLSSSSSSSSSSSPALPLGVRDSGLVPTQCLGLTVVVGGGGCGAPGAAVQVAWRAGRRQQQKGKEAEAEEAYFSFVVRVLPLIGVDAEAAARLENWLEDQVQQQLRQQARDERSMPPPPPFLTVSLKALTDCVLACRGKLDSLLRLEAGESVTSFGSAVARSAQASSYSALSWGGLVQRAVRIAGRRGTQALTPFDRWAEADNKHAAQEAEEEKEEEEEELERGSEGGGGKGGGRKSRKKAGHALVFGAQACVVCQDVFSNPTLGSVPKASGGGGGGEEEAAFVSGGAALAACGHWTCGECWGLYLASCAGDGLARISCPAFQCPSIVGRDAAAHLIAAGGGSGGSGSGGMAQTGGGVFERIERFRSEKLMFLQRVQQQQEDGEEKNEENEGSSKAGGVGNRSRSGSAGGGVGMARARLCPNPACDLLLKPTAFHSNEDEGNEGTGFFGLGPGLGPGSGQWLLCCEGCGHTTCGECGGEEGHFGVRCQEKAAHASKLVELDKESASLLWLASNTKPCPKCAYPIEKNGGCLHVRCQQCTHYFCWQCSGPGSVCQAFSCKNSGNGGAGFRAAASGSNGMQNMKGALAKTLSAVEVVALASTCQTHTTQALQQRKSVLLQQQQCNKGGGGEQEEGEALSSEPRLKAQLLLTSYLLWLRTFVVFSAMAGGGGSPSTEPPQRKAFECVQRCLERVELLLHALSERTHHTQTKQHWQNEVEEEEDNEARYVGGGGGGGASGGYGSGGGGGGGRGGGGWGGRSTTKKKAATTRGAQAAAAREQLKMEKRGRRQTVFNWNFDGDDEDGWRGSGGGGGGGGGGALSTALLPLGQQSALSEVLADKELAALLSLSRRAFEGAVSDGVKKAFKALAHATSPPPPPPSSSSSSAAAARYRREASEGGDEVEETETERRSPSNRGSSSKNRGSSRPAEDLLKRHKHFAGLGVPGGAKAHTKKLPPWQDKRGLLDKRLSVAQRRWRELLERDKEEEKDKREVAERRQGAGDAAAGLSDEAEGDSDAEEKYGGGFGSDEGEAEGEEDFSAYFDGSGGGRNAKPPPPVSPHQVQVEVEEDGSGNDDGSGGSDNEDWVLSTHAAARWKGKDKVKARRVFAASRGHDTNEMW